MARTKQTARCAVQAVYKFRPPTFNSWGRTKKAKRSNSPDSSSEESIDAAHQQFSWNLTINLNVRRRVLHSQLLSVLNVKLSWILSACSKNLRSKSHHRRAEFLVVKDSVMLKNNC